MPDHDPASHRSSLIVLSNRLPYNIPREPGAARLKRNVGGLVNALEPALVERGRGTWIGWDGLALRNREAVEQRLGESLPFLTDGGVRLVGVPLHEREHQRYYYGLSNRTLWPLYHGRVDITRFVPEHWQSYRDVNRRFADVALARLRPGDRVWAHDYHLQLLPRLLRERGFAGRVDFFLHIPFPPPEIFAALPWREEILRGLLAADAVVFHVEPYRDNFVRAAGEILGARTLGPDADGRLVLEHDDGATAVAAAPIGIDVDDFERISRLESVRAEAWRLRLRYGGVPILFGADRLDYTKGIRERFLAVERFLAQNPRAAGSFTTVQVVVPSRAQVQEYRTLKQELDREVGRINGEYGREGWVPIHYMFRALDREDLVAHYLAASVALVTPLRDGMNLVAPEFVASRTDDRGVLLLSEFAGVARRLDDAIKVNPFDLDGCARAVRDALAMPEPEQEARMRGMRWQVGSNTARDWSRRCLSLPVPRSAPRAVRGAVARLRPRGAKAEAGL